MTTGSRWRDLVEWLIQTGKKFCRPFLLKLSDPFLEGMDRERIWFCVMAMLTHMSPPDQLSTPPDTATLTKSHISRMCS